MVNCVDTDLRLSSLVFWLQHFLGLVASDKSFKAPKPKFAYGQNEGLMLCIIVLLRASNAIMEKHFECCLLKNRNYSYSLLFI